MSGLWEQAICRMVIGSAFATEAVIFVYIAGISTALKQHTTNTQCYSKETGIGSCRYIHAPGSSSSSSVSQKGGDVEGLSLSARSQDLHSDKDSPDRLCSSSLIPAVLAAESSVTAEPAIRKIRNGYSQLHACKR